MKRNLAYWLPLAFALLASPKTGRAIVTRTEHVLNVHYRLANGLEVVLAPDATLTTAVIDTEVTQISHAQIKSPMPAGNVANTTPNVTGILCVSRS